MLLCAFTISVSVNAQTPADSPCDPDYYDSLEARAWLEAQREITQNQNLIFKPDSVLEYTCFDKYMNVLAKAAPDMLSGTTDWGNEVTTDMASALNGTVTAMLVPYINANFETSPSGSYDLLGGRLGGIDHVPTAVAAGDYACDIMNQVWLAAKCMSFADAEQDGFFTFADYAAGDDKRVLPTVCPGVKAKWKSEYETALVTESTAWLEDPVVTYSGLLASKNCVEQKSIETGLTVNRTAEPRTYKEKICLAAGCNYLPIDENRGSCCSGTQCGQPH